MLTPLDFIFFTLVFTASLQVTTALSNTRWLAGDHGSQPAGASECADTNPSAILIGVISGYKNAERRKAIRDTYGSDPRVKLFFVVGRPHTVEGVRDIWNEASTYEDVVVLSHIIDHYRNTSHHTLELFRTAYSLGPCYRYVVKADDDTYVHIDRLTEFLKSIDLTTSPYAYIGQIYDGSNEKRIAALRNSTSKWYISESEWPEHGFPQYAQGSGYVLTWPLAKEIAVGGACDRSPGIQWLKYEDILVGAWVEHVAKYRGLQVQYVSDTRFSADGCAWNDIITHHVGEYNIRCMSERGGACCGTYMARSHTRRMLR